ncbi:MAG TPA: DUF192 domain-containing protein [Candidatus Humimicrobiaceae bacterium]
MRLFRIKADHSDLLISNDLKIADTFFRKLFGLVFSAPLKEGEGLLINNCNSIHTFWMRYSVDVLFLDSDNRVIRFYEDLKPFRVSPFIRGASKTIELKSGSVRVCSLKTGDWLKLLV